MSCVAGLYLLGVCAVCGLVVQTIRVKLKTRYSLTLIALVILFLIYSKFPVCGNPVFPFEQNFEKLTKRDSKLSNALPQESSRVNGRELFDVLEINEHNYEPHSSQDLLNFHPTTAVHDTNNYKRYEENTIQKEEELMEEDYIDENDVEIEMDDTENLMTPDHVTIAKLHRDPIEREENEDFKVNAIDDAIHEAPDANEGDEDENEDEIDDGNDYVSDDDVATEAMESPKYNGSNDNAAPKQDFRHFHSWRKDNFLYQINIAKEEKTKYFVDYFPNKKLLPHLSSAQAKIKFQDILPWWEKVEINNFPEVWYVGERADKKIPLNQSNPNNFGFDILRKTDGGIYKIVKGDHLEYRYEILEKLGRGSYGIVVRARDRAISAQNPQHLVAIKIMHNDSSTEKYFKLELDLMEMIRKKTNHSEHFSTVLRTFFFRNHFCIVMELLQTTLEETREDQPVKNLDLLRKYTLDILNGLSLLHNANVIHGDLKPENLMMIRNGTISSPIWIKIVDFSLSCIPDSFDFPCPGTHFQTRLYRAPEVSMNLNYTETADMWSVGVILAELYMNRVPFYGETNTDQLAAIMEVMGLLPPYMVEVSPNIGTYQKAICYKCKNGFERTPYRKSFQKILADVPEDLYDFIEHCFELDYKKRMTSSEALHHRFINPHIGKDVT